MKKDEAGQGMDYVSKLRPGTKGEIAINAGIHKGRYSSRVEDIKDDAVALACPLKKGTLVPIYKDMDFTFTMGDGGALYSFDMAAWRIEVLGGLPLLWAVNVSEPQRIQRRQFLRISCFLDILIFPVEAEARAPMSVMWRPAKAHDMSLRGTCFRLDDETAGGLTFEFGDRLIVTFKLFDKKHFLLGRATRIDHENHVWQVGLAFDSVAGSVERQLFEFIRQQEIMGREG